MAKTVENYKKAKQLYNEIDESFYDIENGVLENSEFQINQILNKVNTLEKLLKFIDIEDLKEKYPPETINAVKENKEIFEEAVYFWKRYFLGGKYVFGLKDPIMLKYVPGLKLDQTELDKLGKSEETLSKEIIATLTSDLYVLEYEKAIKRIILGTMTQKEFNRLFDVILYKKYKHFRKDESINIPNIENLFVNEDFFNPFVEDDGIKETEPKHITDDGGTLILRKETFNLARVEFSKRPGGEFTILSKTQFAKGEIVEICPVIILKEESKTIDSLKDIIFEIDKDKNEWALVLGYGSLYRHSDKANVDYAYNKLTKQMYFITNRPIKLAEELTINYGKDYWMERMSFNTIGSIKPNNDEDKPILGKAIIKNESEVQPNATDIQGTNDIKYMSSPDNDNQPIKSGIAIIGGGQS